MLRFIGILALLLVAYLALHASRSTPADVQPTRVEDILAAPDRFANQSVTVQGIVVSAIGIAGVGGYHLRDINGQHEIFVVSAGGGVPPAGSTVTVSGVFREAATIGSYKLSAIVLTP